jgi:hypothetical protein
MNKLLLLLLLLLLLWHLHAMGKQHVLPTKLLVRSRVHTEGITKAYVSFDRSAATASHSVPSAAGFFVA